MFRTLILTAVAGAALATALPAAAHHSRVMFDLEKRMIVKGTVVRWTFGNPHAIIVLSVKDDDGTETTWQVEGGSNVSAMTRVGWSRDSIKPGEVIEVTFFPMRSGAPSGSFENDSVVIYPEGGPVEGISPLGRQ